MKTTNVKFLVVLLISLFSVKASAHNIEVKNADGVTIYYNYINNNSELAVSYRGSQSYQYNEYYGNVVIPESVTYNGKTYSVTRIGNYAFENCSGLTSVTIPNSVTSIGDYAFRGCSGLTSITIPNSVTSIGESAFYGCSGLTSITIPNSMTSIGESAFYGCSGLTSVTIPNSVTSIRWGTFYGCSGLTSITIPNSVTSIGYYAFSGCSGLTNVNISDLAAWCNISFSNFSANPLYYANHLFLNGEEIKDLVIPNSVTSIGSSAFEGCSGLTSVTIPNSVASIGDEAFLGCSGLTSVTIPNSVTSIGYEAFYDCSGLTSITIPNSVTSIGESAFSGCSGLTSVTIPNSVTKIGDWAFSGCSGLSNITVETGNAVYDSRNNCNAIIKTSSNELIAGCKNTVIPNSVTSIEHGAFSGCSGLTSITIPNSVTSIGSNAFDGTAWYNNQPDGLVYAGKVAYKFKGTMQSNTSIVIEEGTLGIAGSAFFYCSGLTSVTIPNSVTSIGDYAFYGCSGLTSVTIPNSVTSIGDYAFYGCSGLTSVTIPNSVTSIGSFAFMFCNNMKAVYSEIESPFDIDDNSFDANTFAGILYVPANTRALYKNRNGWKNFKNIEENITTFVLSIFASGNGSASYAGTTVRGTTRTFDVTEGSTASITFTPDEGYRIASVMVNGTDVTSGVQNGQYVINEVNDNIIIEVSFVKIPSNFTDNGMNYAVTSFSGRQVMVTDGSYGTVLTVPATVTFQNETWKVAGIENGMLVSNSQLAAVIWEPEAVFTAHVSNPNLLLYVKSAGYAPAGIRNVVVDGVANNIVLTDATNGNDFYCPQAFTASRISYTHNYSMTTGIGESKGWESIALPFDVAKTVHASKGEMVPYQTWDGTDSKKPYWLMELGAGGFVNANAIKANTPYIISMPNHPNYREDYRLNGSVTFSAENVRVARTDDVEEARQGDRHFVPNFANRQGTGVYALNVNSDYVTYTGGLATGSRFVPNLRTLHPFEAYMTSTATTRMPIVIGDNMATAIAEVPAMMEETLVRVYLPSGQLVVAEKDKSLDEVKAQLPAGVYIVNGQKLIIK